MISGPDPVAPILPPVQHDKARSSSLRFYLLAALITMVAAIGTYLLVRTLAAKEPVDTPSAAVPDGAPAPAVTPLDAAPPVKPPEVKPPEVKPPEVKPPEVKPPEVKPPPKKPPPSSTTNATKPKPSLTTVKPKPPETGSAKARIEPKVDPYDRSHPNTGPISDPPPSKKDGTELLEPSGTKPAGR